MTELTPFMFQGSALRTTELDGQPAIVLADIAKILGYRDASNASRILRDHHKGYSKVRTPGGEQEMLVVTEKGFNRLVLKSNAPNADQIQDWVTDEVLPSISQTGSYGRALTLEQRSLALISDLNNEVQRQAAQIEAQAPLVAQAETYSEGRGKQTRQQFARDIAVWAWRERGARILQADVMTFLSRKLGLFVTGERRDAGEATTEALRRGLADTNRGTAKNGHNFSTGYLTPEGVQYAWDRCVRYIDQHGNLDLPKRERQGNTRLEVVS